MTTGASGVTVSQDCIDKFQDLKLKKKHAYILFTLNKDKTEIIVDKTSSSTKYEEFTNDLPEAECRWAVYNFEFDKGAGGHRNKIVFIAWSPEDAKMKERTLFASSKDVLRRSLSGIGVEIQGNDFSEVAYESVFDKASRGA
ncbi:actin-binding ADF family protein [Streptomyces noursei]|uniref:actin-binding ADF family protein n=1 Tax=Streptomyces noursei TaxID=1971 RepID=UPI003631BBB4